MIRKIHKKGTRPDPLRGLFEAKVDGKLQVVEYEPDTSTSPGRCGGWRRSGRISWLRRRKRRGCWT
jgi:hypothetical protein